jgi:predicted Zn-dependent peptidase
LQPVASTVLDHGLTLVVETMPEVQSAAFSLLVPGGSASDPLNQSGLASVLCEWMTRGAGPRDSRELSAELDRLGVQHGQTVTPSHLVFNGACLAEKLAPALALTADMVCRPLLAEDEYDASVAAIVHQRTALEDEPRQKVMLELIRRCYPAPWGQPPEGELEDLERLRPNAARAQFARCVRPQGAILGVAGRVTIDDVLPAVREAFSQWTPGAAPPVIEGPRGPAVTHLPTESAQTHIGVAFPAVPYRHPDYFAAWAAVSVLSGGMSSRLFTEIREKRGLCYAVYATLSTLRDIGAVLCYAGTTSERAQQTFDVLIEELLRLQEGVGDDELCRSQALAKSALVMQQESSSARAGSVARDWYHLGRVTTLDEIQRRIEALTPADVVDYIRRCPPVDRTVVTIGPTPLA